MSHQFFYFLLCYVRASYAIVGIRGYFHGLQVARACTDESFYYLHIFLSPKSYSPELVYELELAALSEAESKGKASKAQAHREEASAARSVLPHFNLEGLWVGK